MNCFESFVNQFGRFTEKNWLKGMIHLQIKLNSFGSGGIINYFDSYWFKNESPVNWFGHFIEMIHSQRLSFTMTAF